MPHFFPENKSVLTHTLKRWARVGCPSGALLLSAPSSRLRPPDSILRDPSCWLSCGHPLGSILGDSRRGWLGGVKGTPNAPQRMIAPQCEGSLIGSRIRFESMVGIDGLMAGNEAAASRHLRAKARAGPGRWRGIRYE